MPNPWINNEKTEKIVIIGAGGFGREVVSHIRDINAYAEANGLPPQWEILGFIDDGTPDVELCHRFGLNHLGGSGHFDALPEGTFYIIAIGNGSVRRKIAERADAAGLRAATLVHPESTIGSLCEIGEGTIVCPGTRITCNLSVGKHCQLNLNVTVGHEAVIEDFATIFPLNAISGFVRLCEESTIGANSVINPGVTVGEGAYVGSGAAVNKDVPEYTLVAGVPAQVKKTLR